MDDDSPDSANLPPVQGNGRSPGDDGTDRDDGDPSHPPEAGHVGPIYSTRVKVLVVIIGLIATAAMSWVYLSTVDTNGSATSTSGAVAQGIENVRPAAGSQIPEQTTVALDLTPGWDGRLVIDGTPVPETDLTRSAPTPAGGDAAGSAVPGTGDGQDRRDVVPRLEFVPGPERTFDALPSGPVCVEAEVWRLAGGPEGERQTHEWCFTVF